MTKAVRKMAILYLCVLSNPVDEMWLRNSKFWVFVHPPEFLFFLLKQLSYISFWMALPWTLMWLEN